MPFTRASKSSSIRANGSVWNVTINECNGNCGETCFVDGPVGSFTTEAKAREKLYALLLARILDMYTVEDLVKSCPGSFVRDGTEWKLCDGADLEKMYVDSGLTESDQDSCICCSWSISEKILDQDVPEIKIDEMLANAQVE